MRTRGRAIAAAVLIGGCTAGCRGENAADGRPFRAAEWSVAPEPTVRVGVVEGAAGYQLHDVTGAVRLSDGRIAVLNAGSAELRIYDDAGRHLSSSGRSGDGPGEFRQAARLYRFGDTLGIYDAGLRRLSLHDEGGTFIANRALHVPGGRFPLDEWLYNRSWIDGPPLGVGRAPIMALVDGLPAPDSSQHFRYLRVSRFGHVWWRQGAQRDGVAQRWHIYSLAGEPVAAIELPAGFTLLDYDANYVLGTVRDESDVEFIQLHRLDAGRRAFQPHEFVASAADTVLQVEADSAFAPRRRELMAALRMLTGAQEIHYSTPQSQYRYAGRIEDLAGYQPPEGVLVRIVRASNRGWVAVAIDEATGRMCGMAVGRSVPVGWSPGRVGCQ